MITRSPKESRILAFLATLRFWDVILATCWFQVLVLGLRVSGLGFGDLRGSRAKDFQWIQGLGG